MKRLITTLSLLLVALWMPALHAQHNEHTGRFEFTATASSIGVPGNPVGEWQVDIVVSRWSTEAERLRLLGALKKNSQDKLLSTLQDMKPVGTIRINNQGLSYDLRYAHERPDPEGGRQIVLGTDRPISAWEAANQPRTVDYPFTFIQMHLDNDGHGTGTIVPAAKITGSEDGHYVTIENFAAAPIKLNDVQQK